MDITIKDDRYYKGSDLNDNIKEDDTNKKDTEAVETPKDKLFTF